MAGTDSIVGTMMALQHQLKLHHWQTRSYARHKALDKFLKAYAPLLDMFVESYQGALRRRVRLAPAYALELHNLSDAEAVAYVESFECFLNSVVPEAVAGFPDLLNIRDEMLGHVHQLLYLCSLR